MKEFSIEVKVKLQLEDVINLTYQLYFKKIVFIAAVVSIPYFIVASIPKIHSILDISVYTGIIALAISAEYFVAKAGLKALAKRGFNTNKLIQMETTYVFSDSGIQISNIQGQSVVNWDQIYKVNTGKDTVAIFISDRKVLLIPKRCFSDSSAVEELQQLLLKKLPPNKVKVG